MIAARFPRADVPSCIAPVQVQGPLPVAASVPPSERPSGPSAQPVSLLPPAHEPRPKIEPLSATRYRIEVTVSDEIRSTLERIKDLMRHRNPTGDLEMILEASLGLLLAKLEKERLGKTSRPRKAKTQAPGPAQEDTKLEVHWERADGPEHRDAKAEEPTAPARANADDSRAAADAEKPARRGYISNETRREVFARDGERCTYVDAEGHRCPARGHLELDHVHARALGGSHGPENLRIRCRRHNQLYAEQVFGRAHIEERIHFRHGKSAAAQSPVFETAGRALRTLGFREPEVKRALATLATKVEARTATIETVIREALLVLT